MILCDFLNFLVEYNILNMCMPRSVFISYSGPSGLLGSDGKQNTAKSGNRGHENCCTFH